MQNPYSLFQTWDDFAENNLFYIMQIGFGLPGVGKRVNLFLWVPLLGCNVINCRYNGRLKDKNTAVFCWLKHELPASSLFYILAQAVFFKKFQPPLHLKLNLLMAIITHNPSAVFPPYRSYSHAVEVTGNSSLLIINGLNGHLADGQTMPETLEEQGEIIWQ